MKQSEIEWEILEDGTVSITTDDLSGPNHHSADELLKQLGEIMGGHVDVKKRSHFAHVHTHAHGGHVHQH